jgi:hypothetical protein
MLAEKKRAILQRWCDRIMESYPAHTSKFLKSEADPFANPVGSIIRKGTEGVIEHLVQGTEPAQAAPFLDPIVRVRAVQDLPPSEATAFILQLKEALREELGSDLEREDVAKEWQELESRIDGLMLLAFDLYVQCREKVWELKTAEMKNRSLKRIERSGEMKRGSRP